MQKFKNPAWPKVFYGQRQHEIGRKIYYECLSADR